MNKKILIISLICLAVLIVVVLFFGKTMISSGDSELIIFYSETCPHCENLEKFLEENKIAEKVAYIQKRVDNSQANVTELVAKAKSCGIQNGVGIPFLWDAENSKCIIGDVDAINFFKDKIK